MLRGRPILHHVVGRVHRLHPPIVYLIRVRFYCFFSLTILPNTITCASLETDAKKRKISLPMTNRPRAGHELELTGTVWDSRKWSCAYDSVCVTLFHTLRTRSLNFVDAASRISPLMAFLSNGTRSLLTET